MSRFTISRLEGASRILGMAGLTGLLSIGAAHAGKINDMRKCASSVEIVQGMLEESDSGDKEKAMVATLIDLTRGLCDRKRFEEAEDALGVARGIMGTEEGAGTDKDDDKKT